MVVLFCITTQGQAEEGREAKQQLFFYYFLEFYAILFSLYCCSSANSEHFPTNAIKYWNIWFQQIMFIFCFTQNATQHIQQIMYQ